MQRHPNLHNNYNGTTISWVDIMAVVTFHFLLKSLFGEERKKTGPDFYEGLNSFKTAVCTPGTKFAGWM